MENPSWEFSSDSDGSKEKLLDAMSSFPNSSYDNSPTAGLKEEITEPSKVGQKRSRETKGKQKVDVDEQNDIHILTERERRKRMRSMFSGLHALLPRLPVKADKRAIVDEALKYIKTLQYTLQILERQKLERLRNATVGAYETSGMATPIQPLESRESLLANQGPYKALLTTSNPLSVPPHPTSFQTWFSPNVVMNLCGDDAQISVCSVKKKGLSSIIFHILEKHNLDVVSAHVSSNQYRSMYMIHAHAGEACGRPEGWSVEEIFKLAVGEMNLMVLSY